MMTAADVLIETFIDWGVDIVFGGRRTQRPDGITADRQDQIRFVQVRHEESAAFMACAYAKFTGRSGGVFGNVSRWTLEMRPILSPVRLPHSHIGPQTASFQKWMGRIKIDVLRYDASNERPLMD
jgi:hypothetical protein